MKMIYTFFRQKDEHAFNSVMPGILLILVLSVTGCRDFVEIDPPPTRISSDVVFASDEVATAAVFGIYAQLYNNTAVATTMTIDNGLAADELQVYTVAQGTLQFFNNALTPVNNNVVQYWNELYNCIYAANSVIEGIEASTGLSMNVRKQLHGEVLFIRAYCYFYLVNLWGNVPIVLTTDYRNNVALERSTRERVYSQMVSDLTVAKAVLAKDYAFSEGDRARPNTAAATALLARVYLFQREWAKAAEEATILINNSADYALVEDLNGVFLKNSAEAIWQIMPTGTLGNNTKDADFFVLETAPGYVALREDFVTSFEAGDGRVGAWIGTFVDVDNENKAYHYPNKYKVKFNAANPPPGTEYLMVFRLAEQYLIRAEARAQLSDLNGAISDLDVIRDRAGLSPLSDGMPNIDQANFLQAVERERKAELFTEWGHRWLDLKRTGRATAVLGGLKAGWSVNDELYPVPQNEIDKNPSLRPQNTGY